MHFMKKDTLLILYITLYKDELKVKATSSGAPDAVLTVEGYGVMSFKSGPQVYEFKDKPVANPGGSVTVTSSLGGSDTAPVPFP